MTRPLNNLIGVIGVGLLGTALCHRLRGAGHSVIGYDLQQEQLDDLVELGGQAAKSIEDVAAATSVIILSLPDSTISKAVCAQLAHCAAAGSTVIDTTTGAPEDAVDNSKLLGTSNIRFMEATVAGASSQVKEGSGVFMVGGPDDLFRQHTPLLGDLSNVVFHVGEVGAGARVKLVVNLALGLNRAVLAESLALAEAAGIPLHSALEVLKATPAYSAAMDVKGEKMITQDFSPQARLKQHRKDVGLIRQLAAQHQQELPLSTLHAQLLDSAIDAGYGELDNSAIYKVIRGYPLP